MINITNGVQKLTVTNAAYNSIYKWQGFTPVSEIKAPIEDVDALEPDVEVEQDPVFEEDTAEVEMSWSDEQEMVPIGEWSKEDIERFVKDNNIDLGGAKKAAAVKAKVKEWIESK